jgi:serine/threonine protein kinase
VRAHAPARRLPVREAVEIILPLTEALGFLHERELTHRDIKPQNIIFVNGRPKLADIGLIAKVRGRHEEGTYIGTPGYMPPAPETPGTREADIYGLGMVLYVISTGCDPGYFPELSTGLIARTGEADFIRLNAIILKACHQDRERRYSSVEEFRAALLDLQKTLQGSVEHVRGETLTSTKPMEGI